MEDEPVRWDPARHLQFEPPAYIKSLDGNVVQYPVPVSAAEGAMEQPRVRALGERDTIPFAGLAYTAPFKLLSMAGVEALRSVISANEKHAQALKSRAAKSLRGMGYRSKFIRDFNFDERVLGHFARMAGTPLGPHAMSMNLSQVNFGEVNASKAVDEWHIDSVPYVCVVLLSDAADMEGGELQVAMLGDPAEAIERVRAGRVAATEIDVVKYPGPGMRSQGVFPHLPTSPHISPHLPTLVKYPGPGM